MGTIALATHTTKYLVTYCIALYCIVCIVFVGCIIQPKNRPCFATDLDDARCVTAVGHNLSRVWLERGWDLDNSTRNVHTAGEREARLSALKSHAERRLTLQQ